MDIASNGSLEKRLNLDDNSSLRIITRDLIHIFDQRELLDQLKNQLPSGFKIGAAVGEGDCFLMPWLSD